MFDSYQGMIRIRACLQACRKSRKMKRLQALGRDDRAFRP